MIAWLRARSCGGKVILRMEDLDHPRDKPGAAAAALEDLRWLGFDWDEEYVQSQRLPLYRAAATSLISKKLIYPCVCSRKDVENAQSAPHAGEQLHYPGTCRDRFPTWSAACRYLGTDPEKTGDRPRETGGQTPEKTGDRPPKNGGQTPEERGTDPAETGDRPRKNGRVPCWRFRTPPGVVTFEDAFAGVYSQDTAKVLGDFPVARDEAGAGYTLAVVVDDAAMGVTEVVRGDDLLAATPAQIHLYRALGLVPPKFCHVPLVVGEDGRRLAKRHGDTRVASYRAAGIPPERILGLLARSCGWTTARETTLRALVGHAPLETILRTPFVFRTSI